MQWQLVTPKSYGSSGLSQGPVESSLKLVNSVMVNRCLGTKDMHTTHLGFCRIFLNIEKAVRRARKLGWVFIIGDCIGNVLVENSGKANDELQVSSDYSQAGAVTFM